MSKCCINTHNGGDLIEDGTESVVTLCSHDMEMMRVLKSVRKV